MKIPQIIFKIFIEQIIPHYIIVGISLLIVAFTFIILPLILESYYYKKFIKKDKNQPIDRLKHDFNYLDNRTDNIDSTALNFIVISATLIFVYFGFKENYPSSEWLWIFPFLSIIFLLTFVFLFILSIIYVSKFNAKEKILNEKWDKESAK